MCTRCGKRSLASDVVAHLETETRSEPVWVGPYVVQLGPQHPIGQMPHRVEPGYWKWAARNVVVAVLANGQRVSPKSLSEGWSDGAMVCIPCRDQNVERVSTEHAQRAREHQQQLAHRREQERRMNKALAALPAISRPPAPAPPGVLSFFAALVIALTSCYLFIALTVDEYRATDTQPENSGALVKLWLLTSLGVTIALWLLTWGWYVLVVQPRHQAALHRADRRDAERERIRASFGSPDRRPRR